MYTSTGDAQLADLISLLATSLREGLGGLGSWVSDSSGLNLNLGIFLSQEFSQSQEFSHIFISSLFSNIGIELGLSTFLGGFDALGLSLVQTGLGFFSDVSGSYIVDACIAAQLTERVDETVIQVSQAQSVQEAVSITQKVYATIPPGAKPPKSEVTYQAILLQKSLKTMIESNLLNSFMDNHESSKNRLELQEQESIKENQQKVNDIKVNSESDSNENSFGIFVAEAAVQADPVVEVNGMKIWIDPLNAVPYHLDHYMTLNDFLDLIGILNDPSKQAIYTNPITGATYILNLFDGNMPLVDVLDLIGYDRTNLEQQFLGNAHRIQIIDTTTILQLQDDSTALFHPDVRDEIFYRYGITDYQRNYFSKKVLDAFDIVKSRIQDDFRETIYESAYNIIKTRYSEDFGITQEEWLELVDSKVKDEHGAFTQEFEKIVDLCLKEQVFLNLIELSGAQDQDVGAIFSTLDSYLDKNFGSLIEQLFNPLTFEAFISEVINQVLNNMDNEGFVSFSVPTHEYFEDLISNPISEMSLLEETTPPPILKNKDEIEKNHKNELDDLSRLFYRIREYFKDKNIRGLPINDLLLGLQGPGDPNIYTKQYLADIFHDSLELTNEKLKNMHLTQKSFYKILLQQIQNDIQNNQNPAFAEYSFLIGMEFSLDDLFDEFDLQIVKFIDEIMNKKIGYIGYTLLKLDLIRLDGNNDLIFQMPSDLTTFIKIMNIMGIQSIANFNLNGITSRFNILEYIEKMVWSILLSGHYMKMMTIDKNGQFKLKNEYTYPGTQFLSSIFENFIGNVPDSSYHLLISYNFLNAFFNSYHFAPYYMKENSIDHYLLKNLNNILHPNTLVDNPTSVINEYDNIDARADGKFKYILRNPERMDTNSNFMQWLVTNRPYVINDWFTYLSQALEIDKTELDNDNAKLNAIRKIGKDQYDIGKRRNPSFLEFDFNFENNQRQKGFMWAFSGDGPFPGTYWIDKGGGEFEYIMDPYSKFTKEFMPLFCDGYERWSDSERKLILTLVALFSLDNIESGEIRLVSEKDFCFSCLNTILIFLNKYNDIIDTAQVTENTLYIQINKNP